MRRRDLDQLVAEHAVAAGADAAPGHRGDRADPRGRPRARRGRQGQGDAASTREIRARYVVVADGANSPLRPGARRRRATASYPQGMAIRGYYESPLHDDPWIESALDVRDRNGNSLPGYGWIFPVGDGTINVGIGLLSTFRDWKSVNTSHLMDEFAAHRARRTGASRRTTSCGRADRRAPADGRLGDAERRARPGWSSATPPASINPFNGEGIDYAYETGRMAAGLLDEALTTGDGMALQRYPAAARRRVRPLLQGGPAVRQGDRQPALLGELTRVGMHSRTLMEWVLRIMANLLRADELGPAEAVYKAVAAVWPAVVPEPGVGS